eukprot:670782-Amphidinium_carterae.1
MKCVDTDNWIREQTELSIEVGSPRSETTSMCGTQDASQIRQKGYTKLLGGKQWAQGRSNGGLFLATATGAKAVVHGDDSCCWTTTTRRTRP